MTLFLHEMKRSKVSLIIWTAAISFMLGVCILIYPEMSTQMGDISAMFADMGSFSAAFGMDQINFGEFIGFFGIECGNVLGLGGALFAAIIGISALSKEEKEHTAEFLLTHPISRTKIVAEKLCAVFTQLVILNVVVVVVTFGSILIIGEDAPIKTLALLFVAYFILQIEIAAISFGISSFISKGGIGIGLGLAIVFYFLNIISNLTEKVKFLKYITPFGYTESADIISDQTLSGEYILVGVVFTIIAITTAFYKYYKKDIV